MARRRVFPTDRAIDLVGNTVEFMASRAPVTGLDLTKYGLVVRSISEPELGWRSLHSEVEVQLYSRPSKGQPAEYEVVFEAIAIAASLDLETWDTPADVAMRLVDTIDEHVEYLRDAAERLATVGDAIKAAVEGEEICPQRS